MSNPDDKSEFMATLAAGSAIAAPHMIADNAEAAYAVVPKGYELHNLERYFPRPLRVRQQVTLNDTDSFISYLNAYGQSLTTRLFFGIESESFEAVIDYHASNQDPAWGEHKATFKPVRSVEFTTWTSFNNKQFTQVDFARFLEGNLPDVVEPPGAELLEVALTMEARKEATFSSGVRLGNGQIQFAYDEVIRGSAKKGTLEIPEQFVLGIAIHEGGPAYRIPVRLRWRLHENKAIFWYELVRPHRFVADAIREIREKITTRTGYRILTGSPR